MYCHLFYGSQCICTSIYIYLFNSLKCQLTMTLKAMLSWHIVKISRCFWKDFTQCSCLFTQPVWTAIHSMMCCPSLPVFEQLNSTVAESLRNICSLFLMAEWCWHCWMLCDVYMQAWSTPRTRTSLMRSSRRLWKSSKLSAMMSNILWYYFGSVLLQLTFYELTDVIYFLLVI